MPKPGRHGTVVGDAVLDGEAVSDGVCVAVFEGVFVGVCDGVSDGVLVGVKVARSGRFTVQNVGLSIAVLVATATIWKLCEDSKTSCTNCSICDVNPYPVTT